MYKAYRREITLLFLLISMLYGLRTVPDFFKQAQMTVNYEWQAKNLTNRHYTLRPLATYEGNFRVLGIEQYHMDREAELSPMDMVLAWGALALPNNYRPIVVTQSQRWSSWRAQRLPLSQTEIEESMANTHMIPETSTIAEQLQKIRKYDLVWLKGRLVEATSPDGWTWRSSLSRTDRGAGACEVFLVQEVKVIESPSSGEGLFLRLK